MASLCLLWGHKGAAFGGSHGPGRTRLAPTCSGEGWAGKVAAFRVQSAAHQVSRGGACWTHRKTMSNSNAIKCFENKNYSLNHKGFSTNAETGIQKCLTENMKKNKVSD